MEFAFGVGSLVLLAGGITALVRRSMTPGQAGGVLAIAAVVAAIAWLGDLLADRRSLGGFYSFALTASITLAGIAMAVAVVALPHSRRSGRNQ
jgi:hypothetical protein